MLLVLYGFMVRVDVAMGQLFKRYMTTSTIIGTPSNHPIRYLAMISPLYQARPLQIVSVNDLVCLDATGNPW